MEDTLLVGDHLVVDRITLAPPAKWMPLTHYREPKRGDVVVFIKPVPDIDQRTGRPEYLFLVKRLIGVPGDHIHLHDGIVYINGVAQPQPKDGREMTSNPGESIYPRRVSIDCGVARIRAQRKSGQSMSPAT